MEIISFGGFVKNEDVPGKQRNTQSAVQTAHILEELKKVPDGNSLEIKVRNFGSYERYAIQNRLQAKGAKIVCRIEGKPDDKHVYKEGVLHVMKMTAEQWKQYIAQAGAQPAKKK